MIITVIIITTAVIVILIILVVNVIAILIMMTKIFAVMNSVCRFYRTSDGKQCASGRRSRGRGSAQKGAY